MNRTLLYNLFFLFSITIHAQSTLISGKIIVDDADEIINLDGFLIENTTTNARTKADENGLFSIKESAIIRVNGGKVMEDLPKVTKAEMLPGVRLRLEFDNGQVPYSSNINDNKISFLLLHLGYGGIESATINTANSLCDDYDIEIMSFYKLSKTQANKLNDKIKVKYLYNDGPNKEEFLDAFHNHKIFNILIKMH